MYYMAEKCDEYWAECQSTTLLGAKREATKRHAGGWNDGVIMISEGDNIEEPRRLVTSRPVRARRWQEAL